MGSGIAGKPRLPRQKGPEKNTDTNAGEDAGGPIGDGARSQAPSAHPAELISPQPLSYDERRDRWLRANGTLWRAQSQGAERQQI